MKITLRQPDGLAPKAAPTELRDSFATIAVDCRFDRGNWSCINAPAMLRENWGGPYNSIYRFGQDTVDPASYWFRSNSGAEYLRAPFYGDTRELTFVLDGGILKYTTNTAALAGEPYPTVTYLIPDQPAGTLSASVTGTGSGTEQTLLYVQTQVTAEGFQSRPSAATTVVAQSGETVTMAQLAFTSGNYNFGPGAKRQLWRSTNAGTFELRAEKAHSDNSAWVDAVDAVSLGDTLPPALEWHMPPPANAHSLVSMSGSFVMLAAGRDIYPSKIAPDVHAFPEAYRLTTDYQIVGLCALENACVVLTTSYPVLLQGSSPGSMVPLNKEFFEQSCVSKRSIVALWGGAIWASPDGLCFMDASGNTAVLTEKTHRREDWQALNPASIHAYKWEGQYIAFYDAGGSNKGGFLFDNRGAEPRFSKLSFYAQAAYYDPRLDKLFVQVDNDLMTWDAGAPMPASWESKEFTLPHDTTFRVLRVKSLGYSGAAPITVRIYADGALLDTITVTDKYSTRIEGGTRYGSVRIGMDWRGQQPFLIELASSKQEMGNG